MTQAEFNKHYKDFIMHYDRKYKVMDLNFDQVMKMQGVNEDEFKEKIKYVNALSLNELNQVGEYQWVDEEQSDWDNFSDGKSYMGEDYHNEAYHDDEFDY